MSLGDFLCVFGIGVLIGALGSELFRDRPGMTIDDHVAWVNAKKRGALQAEQGFGRDDYPIDYTPAEVEAWRRGWDEYHERN